MQSVDFWESVSVKEKNYSSFGLGYKKKMIALFAVSGLVCPKKIPTPQEKVCLQTVHL